MIDKRIIDKIINEHYDTFEKLAKGAQPNEIKKQYWCPICNTYIEEVNVTVDKNSTSNMPICGFCGYDLQWNYIYK